MHIACVVAAEHASLNGCTNGYNFIWIDPFGCLLSEEILDGVLNGRDTGGTTHQDHLVDVSGAQSCFFECRAARFDRAVDQV